MFFSVFFGIFQAFVWENHFGEAEWRPLIYAPHTQVSAGKIFLRKFFFIYYT
jgi:hypothetical protein